jgi:hypothetical protein
MASRRAGGKEHRQGRLAAGAGPATEHSRLRGRGGAWVAGRDRPRPAHLLRQPRKARLVGDPVPRQPHQRPQTQARQNRRRRHLHQADAGPGRLAGDPGTRPATGKVPPAGTPLRRGEEPAAKKAITAIAHTLLKIACQVLKERQAVSGPGRRLLYPAGITPAAPGLPDAAAAKTQPRLHHHHHPRGGSLTAPG